MEQTDYFFQMRSLDQECRTFYYRMYLGDLSRMFHLILIVTKARSVLSCASFIEQDIIVHVLLLSCHVQLELVDSAGFKKLIMQSFKSK